MAGRPKLPKIADLPTELNDQMVRFVHEYLCDDKYNATQAAIRAGYSPKTAKQAGSRLLKHSGVRELKDKLEAERLGRLSITADRIKNEMAKIAFANMADFVEVKKNRLRFKDFDKMSRLDTAAISEITQKTGNVSERGIKLHSKPAILETLARMDPVLGEKLKSKHEVTGKDGGPIQTEAKVMIYIPDNGRGDPGA